MVIPNSGVGFSVSIDPLPEVNALPASWLPPARLCFADCENASGDHGAMCFSAQVWEDYERFIRKFGATINFDAFARLYADRRAGQRVPIAKAMDAAFARAPGAAGARIREMIADFNMTQTAQLEAEIFKQRKRLAMAERSLESKPTKKATEDQRIARQKVSWALNKLSELRRDAPKPDDSRIFPGWYAPVMLWENNQRVVRPMRYGCRPAGKPALYDRKYPGTYNARRDNLEGFWRGQFGCTHGVIVVNAFHENVSRHRVERRELADGEREENVVLEFRPRPTQDMLVACLWSQWTASGEPDLWSFAAITDEPPPEIAAAGHDRCIIPIKAEHVDAWLNPDGDIARSYAILDDRERPFYVHSMAA
jgi:putative SOS response-associated peptidase YedK